MSIQRRVSIILLVIITAFGGLCYTLLVNQMGPVFLALEEEAVHDNLARAERILEDEFDKLESTGFDWAAWEATQRFILGQYDNYVEENLDSDTFDQFGLDLVLFLDNEQRSRWGSILSESFLGSRWIGELELGDKSRLQLLNHDSPHSVIAGYVATKYGPMVVSSRPIVGNNFEGPMAGTLLFGYFLDSQRVESFRAQTEVDMTFLPASDRGYQSVARDFTNNFGPGHWQTMSPDHHTDYVDLPDIAGNPLLVLQVQTPRNISSLGQDTLNGTFLVFAILVLSVAIAIWMLLRMIVVRPLHSLTQHVKAVELSGDMSRQLPFTRKDEIGELARAFGDMQIEVLSREDKVNESLLELEHQASHDALTGLANRRTLYRHLENLKETHSSEFKRYCVCIMDLDRFKIVNDTSGHAAGDELLVQVATILKESCYTTDTIVRLGGDEFALLLYDCAGEQAARICERIREQIETMTFVWDDVQHRIGASVGVLSVSDPSTNVSEILQRADAACFAAKESGRNQVNLVEDFEPAVDDKRRELHWVQRLTTALDRDQFLLFSQPIVPLQDHLRDQTDRMEVLVRLRDFAAKRLVPPGAFIPSAERYKLSPKIDQWVITQVIRYTLTYDDVFGDQRMYWVNLSGASLCDDNFTNFLEKSIIDNRLPEGRLNFEITESFAIQNVSQVTRVMNRLKELGCQFALDDFGTGFSSFNYLQVLPIDCIKIDGLIVRRILDKQVDQMFVKSIIDIAHAMDVVSVAEFVESPELVEKLSEMGADYGQGFALGRPEEIMPMGSGSEAHSKILNSQVS